MNNRELLHRYLDADLNEEQEKELFRAMGSDDSLRHDLGNILKVRSLLKSAAAPAMPSPSVRSAVFDRLGVSDGPVKTISPKPKVTWLKTLGLGIMIGVALVISTLMIFKASDDVNVGTISAFAADIDSREQGPAPENIISVSSVSNNINSGSSVPRSVRSAAVTQEDSNIPILTNAIHKTLPELPDFYETYQSTKSEKISNQITMYNSIPEKENRMAKTDLGTDTRAKESESDPAMTGTDSAVKSSNEIIATLDYSLPWFLPSGNQAPTGTALNNLSLSCYYALTDELFIGATVMQEQNKFLTENWGYNTSWTEAEFEQTTTAYISLLFINRGPTFEPYGALHAGTDKSWPILKGGIGAFYHINKNWLLNASISYSSLIYTDGGVNRYSNKFSVTFGLGYYLGF